MLTMIPVAKTRFSKYKIFTEYTKNYLNICLEREEINMLPITAVESNLIPILGNSCTAAQTWYIQIRKHPA